MSIATHPNSSSPIKEGRSRGNLNPASRLVKPNHVPPSESDIPASVPNFKSFAHITDARVRRAKEYEQYLMFGLDRFPELEDRINQELEWARNQSKRTTPSDRDRIFASLELCDLTRAEIAEDTDIPPATVYKHLRELVKHRLVSESRRPGIGNNMFVNVYSQIHRQP